MDKKIRAASLIIAHISVLHAYLWAFGIFEPKYEWFGAVLFTLIAFSFVGFLTSSLGIALERDK